MNFNKTLTIVILAVPFVLFTDFVAMGQSDPPPQLEDFELTDQQMSELMDAPKSFMVDEPSPVLRQAMEAWSVQRIRADRTSNFDSPVVQGWIYFEPTDEVRPIILCLSQTGEQIEWMWCQEGRCVGSAK